MESLKLVLHQQSGDPGSAGVNLSPGNVLGRGKLESFEYMEKPQHREAAIPTLSESSSDRRPGHRTVFPAFLQ